MLNFVLKSKLRSKDKSKKEDKSFTYGRCDICGTELIKVGEKLIGTTKYILLKCTKCNKQIARDIENLE
ncbi:MAG: hypothetical protein QXU20_02045 [Candidatus Woesearchaeota archaeon]